MRAHWVVCFALAYAGRVNAEEISKDHGISTKPHTVASLEAGILALPNAPISLAQRGGDTPFGTIGKGDATVLTGLHLLFRAAPDWAIGAGFQFAPKPTADPEYGGLSGLSRTHTRNYFLFGLEGRYVPLRTRRVEGWLGFGVGGVVIADRFDTTVTEAGAVVTLPTAISSRETTTRTEGFSVGIHAGLDWMITDSVVAGLVVRTQRWLVPDIANCTTIGDCATLSGAIQAFTLGLSIGYRIPIERSRQRIGQRTSPTPIR